MNVLSSLLPDENINAVLSFSLPESSAQTWEWTGILGQTCQSFRKCSRDLVPTVINLDDFIEYQPILQRINAVDAGGDKRRAVGDSNSQPFDARAKFLGAITKQRSMAQRVTELHIDWYSLKEYQQREPKVYKALFTLLTTPNSLSGLQWLDIDLQGDRDSYYNIFCSAFLKAMPAALPSLRKLCLANCSHESSSQMSPGDLKKFFEDLRTPLESLSIAHVDWMTDAHVAAFLPVIGDSLTCLELIECRLYENDNDSLEEPEKILTDVSAEAIASACTNLKSFAVVGNELTSSGLEKVLCANPCISTLNLSQGWNLGRDAIGIIARYAPRLKELRSYCTRNSRWLSSWLYDDGLIALIDAQKAHSKGSGIYLEVLGLGDESLLTKDGLAYALNNGLKRIELDLGEALSSSLGDFDTGAEFFYPCGHHYLDGSSSHKLHRYDPRAFMHQLGMSAEEAEAAYRRWMVQQREATSEAE